MGHGKWDSKKTLVSHWEVKMIPHHQPDLTERDFNMVLALSTFFNSTETTSGWWLTYPSEQYQFVNWDDDIPNI